MNFDENMSISDFISEVNHTLNKLVQQMEQVNPVDIGLDQRSSCGPLYINSEWIVSTSASAGVLNYYGGFEYVDSHCVLSMGDYVLYSAEHSRVKRHIRRWEEARLQNEQDSE